jgi:hypothetical protein
MAIEIVKVRAKVKIGNLTVGPNPPYVQSFSVTRNRNSPATCSASVKVRTSDGSGSSLTGGNLEIYAGGGGSASDKIFTGLVQTARISPCFDDPSYVILSVTGSDALSLLEGKKYTRRCRGSLSSWVSIEGVSRSGLKSGKFAVRQLDEFDVYDGNIQKAHAITQTRTMLAYDEPNNPVGPRNINIREVNITAVSLGTVGDY